MATKIMVQLLATTDLTIINMPCKFICQKN